MKEGNTARFELELSHENIPVTWYKNDAKIHLSRTVVTHVDGKKHVLEIKEVTLDDTCQIKAEAKGIPSMANLTVIGKTISLSVFLIQCLFFFPYSRSVCTNCSCPLNNLIVYLRHCFLCCKKLFFCYASMFLVICHLCLLCSICCMCVVNVQCRVTKNFPHSRGRPIFHS